MSQKEFQDLMKRARWDRIGGAFAVLVILIVLIVLIATSCGKKNKDESGGSDSSVIQPVSTEARTEPPVDNRAAVYLSPSTQEDNVYACDASVTEESAMVELAEKVKALLEAQNVRVYICSDYNFGVKEKVAEGDKLKCGAYVALHSNTGSEAQEGQGAWCYYTSGVAGSQALAENVFNRVADLTPEEDSGLVDEATIEEGAGLYEILNNHTPCCLIEVEYHNQADTSQWILDNMDALAKAVSDGISAYLSNTTPAETLAPGAETSAETAEGETLASESVIETESETAAEDAPAA